MAGPMRPPFERVFVRVPDGGDFTNWEVDDKGLAPCTSGQRLHLLDCVRRRTRFGK